MTVTPKPPSNVTTTGKHLLSGGEIKALFERALHAGGVTLPGLHHIGGGRTIATTTFGNDSELLGTEIKGHFISLLFLRGGSDFIKAWTDPKDFSEWQKVFAQHVHRMHKTKCNTGNQKSDTFSLDLKGLSFLMNIGITSHQDLPKNLRGLCERKPFVPISAPVIKNGLVQQKTLPAPVLH